ncbi:MAG: protein kinase [Acidobacteriota bacterium]|nr:protein kinase [Acidobacteriota bacterium]
MSAENWLKIEEIFQSALDLPIAERRPFIQKACEGDKDLESEVEKLVADYESADRFIESPAWTDSDFLSSKAKREIASSLEEEFSDDKIDPLIGRRIGVFELKKEIGRGGMGAVYLAERADGEFRQRVAIKLIKRGMDTDFIVRRFRHERQILANLDHPNIARLLDGGTTEDRLPYFVMEFVNGEPLYQYCDERQLSVRQRLKIFQQVCSAVQAAHQQQIIHRDIKPGNILITSLGVPKLLDFGIAKILDPDLIHESFNPTSTMMRLMTPDYASPEQVRGLEITPASDVYALGILLYELLTGHRPYGFAAHSAHEVSRVICETEPELPSRAVASTQNLLPVYVRNNISAEKAADLRGTTVEDLENELAGNLDRLIMKALRKSPDERFESVREFADDLSRHLNGKEVLAHPPISQAGYFENTLSDSAPTGDKSVAVLPFKLLNIAAGEDTAERFLGVGLADALITRLSNIQRFIVRPTSSVLRFDKINYDPFVAGKELNVEYILDGYYQRVGERIRVSVQLLSVPAQTTVWAGRFDENLTDVLSLEDAISTKVAESLIPHLSAGEREILAKRGTDNPQAFEAYLRGRYYWNTFTEDGFAKAIVAYHEAIAYDAKYALAFAGIADYYNWLGVYGILPPDECFDSAIEAATTAINITEELSEAHSALGFAVVGGKFEWARGEQHCLRALELNPNNATAHVWYSIQLTMEGRFDEGIRHARRAVKLDPLTAFNQHNLGWCLYFARRFDESINQYQITAAANPLYPLAFLGLSWGMRFVGRHQEAIKAVSRAQELAGESVFMLTACGQTHAAAGNRKEAEAVLEKLESLSENRYVSPYHISIIYTFLGDKNKAISTLEKANKKSECWLAWMGVEPAFDVLRDDARFSNLFETTGNPLLHRAETLVMKSDLDTFARRAETVEFRAEEKIHQPPKSALQIPKWIFVTAAMAIALITISYFSARSGWFGGAPKTESAQNIAPNDAAVSGSSKSKVRSFAVLPFTTIGAASEDEQYLGVGTADLISSKISQIVEINVRSASAVRKYLKTEKSPVDVGRELAVDYIVSGSVERKENNVEARLQMTEVANGRVIWSEIFDEPNNNLFALQDLISEQVANSLSLRLTNAEKQNLAKHFTESGEAQQFYLAGRFQFGKRTVEGLRQAISLFEQATKADPNFALAYTGLADCHALLNWYQEPQPPDAWERAKQYAEKAVALDGDLAEAHASLALIKFHYQRDYTSAENEFRRAINLKPNYATAHQWYAFLLSAQERHNEAVAVMRHAEELEPRSAVIANSVANVLFYARQYDESIAQAKRSLEIDPSSVGAHVILRWNYELKGMNEDALATYEKEIAFAGNTPTSRAKQAHVFAAIGRGDEARAIIEELKTSNQIINITPYEIAVIYALVGDRDKSFEWLKKGKNIHAVGFSFARVDPLLDNLRADKRFSSLVQ